MEYRLRRLRGSTDTDVGRSGESRLRYLLWSATALLSLAATAVAAPVPQTAPAPAPATLVPLESYAQLPFMEQPELSPDGTRIAVRMAVKGKSRLAIVPLGDVKHTVLIDPGESDVRGWEWVNDEWLILRVGAPSDVEGDSWYATRAFGVSADGTKMVPLAARAAAQNADDVLWIAHDGSPHILLSMQTSVYYENRGYWPEVNDFDISTGKFKTAMSSTQDVRNWVADGTGVVRMGIAYNDTTRTYKTLYRDNRDQVFRTLSRARGPGASPANVPALFLPEPGKAITFSDDEAGFTALYGFDLPTLQRGDKLFGVAGYDLGELIAGDGGTKLIGVRYSDTRPRTHWFDPDLANIQEQIDKSVGSRQAHIVSWNRDFTVLLVLVTGADRPGTYYVFRTAEGAMHILAKTNADLGPEASSPVSTIRYKARDGLDISAVLTLPRGKAAKGLPLILMPHGGPAVRDDESWDWQAQFLASRGYAVLQPNYRGSSGFGTAFADKGRGQWGLAMQDDLTDAVKWAAEQGIADPKRICIVGASYGGYAALRAAQRDRGVYRCAVSYAGVSDLPAMIHYDGKFLTGGQSKDWFRSQAPDLRGVSPINFAADFSIPVLIMHGR
ncbi:MAG: peptidase, partial [Sphingomonas bacterium]|nr:peptidase [Sphingomonas bacterium]